MFADCQKIHCFSVRMKTPEDQEMPPELYVVANYADLCGEAPIWDAEIQTLYWSDCVGAKFYRYSWQHRRHEILSEGFEVNGVGLHHEGGFVVTNNSGFWRWDGVHTPKLIADEVEGHRCQLNDCIADERGQVLSSSVFYNPTKEYELGRLLALGRDGKVRILDEQFHLGNGLGFSPDGKILYFADSVARRIYAYDYDTSGPHVKNRRVFVQVPDDEGLPDGLTVDAEGFVWSAQWYGSCIVRYDLEGKIERRIKTPAKQTSSLTFGGPELSNIFITSAGKSEAMPVMPKYYNPNSGYSGGSLYLFECGIKGKVEFKARVSL
jgi:sugar lactone lactonase YvrE